MISGLALGLVLGAQLYVVNIRLHEEPKKVAAEFAGNECLEASVNGTCPSGGFSLGEYCYLPEGATCGGCTGGQTGICGAGSCQCSCPAGTQNCNVNQPFCCSNDTTCGMLYGECITSSSSVPPPCDPGEVTCYDLIATDFFCCATGESCGTPNGCIPPPPPPPPPPPSSDPPSSASSDPCASSSGPPVTTPPSA